MTCIPFNLAHFEFPKKETWIFNYFFLLLSSRGLDLFSHSAIQSMCTVEATHLRGVPQFRDLCETKGPAGCCPGWNLGGYIGLINNRSTCFGITVRK